MSKHGMLRRAVSVLALSALLGGCATHRANIAYIDTQRISANWPKFINDQNQLYSDLQSIENSKAEPARKASEVARVQALYGRYQSDLTREVREAATAVARRHGYRLVVTREGRAYGGVDATAEVESMLKITERVKAEP
ncbi:OmpH family outer membrane protein [bacterium]|nr:MAG: OmpH family outer membrane protein [bacterium]